MHSLSTETIISLFKFAGNVAGPKAPHITRLSMYKALKNAFHDVCRPGMNCLAISDSIKFGQNILGLKDIKFVAADYPGHNILDLKFPSESFDFCISDQVLEHVEGDPLKAFSETARVIRRGGYVCHTTCFINQVHGVPKDFWRFTPGALELLAKSCGLQPTLVGGWGNREVGGLLSRNDLRFMPIPDDPANPIYKLAVRNEADWPIVVWIIAKKP